MKRHSQDSLLLASLGRLEPPQELDLEVGITNRSMEDVEGFISLPRICLGAARVYLTLAICSCSWLHASLTRF